MSIDAERRAFDVLALPALIEIRRACRTIFECMIAKIHLAAVVHIIIAVAVSGIAGIFAAATIARRRCMAAGIAGVAMFSAVFRCIFLAAIVVAVIVAGTRGRHA